jgi:hypothetical protein
MGVLENRSLRIDTSSVAKRILFFFAVLVLTFPLIYRCYGIFRADRIVRTEQTFESFTRALEYDPQNGILWWQRGRTSQYSLQAANLSQAISDYRTALSLNPRIGQAWVDLADCYELLSQYDEAERALESACATRPFSPATRWQTGNYFLRRGHLPKMYENFRIVIEYDPEKLGIAMDLAFEVDPDNEQILHKLIPDALESNLQYLEFLVIHHELDLARKTWERCIRNTIPPDGAFEISAVFRYIDGLLAQARILDALQVWSEALQKSGTGIRDPRLSENPTDSGRTNLIWNGSFENEVMRGGLGWRYSETPDYGLWIERENCRQGMQCLRLTFNNSDVYFAHLSQIVPLPEPGNYTLEFHVRSEGLTTDQRPYLSIQAFPETEGFLLRTPMVPPSTPWTRVTLPFKVEPDCRAVQMTLRRNVSTRIDNRLEGSLWLDGVMIYRSTEASLKQD